jgi:MFS family permease
MNHILSLLGAQILFYCGITMCIPAINAIVAINGREFGEGTAMSVLQSSESLGNIVGPLGAGAILDMTGFTPLFYIAGIIIVVAAGSFYLVTRNHDDMLASESRSTI